MASKKPVKGGRAGGRQAGADVAKSTDEFDKELAKLLHSDDPHHMDLQRKVAAVFAVFDQTGQKTVDAREVGTIVRTLGKAKISQTIVCVSRENIYISV